MTDVGKLHLLRKLVNCYTTSQLQEAWQGMAVSYQQDADLTHAKDVMKVLLVRKSA
mgnify:FL=1|jgi:hypothetical protein